MFDALTYDATTNAWEHRRACAHRAEDLNRRCLMLDAQRVGVSEFVLARAADQWGAPFTALLVVFR